MEFWKKISPAYTPPYVASKGELFALKERILQTLLIIFCVLGAPVVVVSSIEEAPQTGYAIIIFFAALYVGTFIITFMRELPYGFRAYLLLGLVYMLAVSQVFENGQLGDVRLFMVVFTTLSALLFGHRTVIGATVLGFATMIAIGLYATIASNPFIPGLVRLREGAGWITTSITFLMISVVLAGAINFVITGLEKALKKHEELTHSLEEERTALEDRVQERTQTIAHRMVQMRTAAEIARTISGLGNPEALLQQVVDLVKDRFGLYYVGIFLIDDQHENAVLHSGTGEAGKNMVDQGHHLSISGTSMIGWCVTNRKPRIALDVGAEAVRFNNPHLPLTRSEMALPIIAHDHTLGAMTVQSDESNAFDENDITILLGIADSLAIALENDLLFNQTRENLEEIRALNREYLQRVWAETIETYGELEYDFKNEITGNQKAAHEIQVPLLLRDEVIGEITLEIDHGSLSEDEAAFVNNVTTQTAIALENARLLQESERRAIQEQKLNELASRFSRAVSIDEILRAAAQELGQLPAVADVSVQLNPVIPPSHPTAPPDHAHSGNGKERSS